MKLQIKTEGIKSDNNNTNSGKKEKDESFKKKIYLYSPNYKNENEEI